METGLSLSLAARAIVKGTLAAAFTALAGQALAQVSIPPNKTERTSANGACTVTLIPTASRGEGPRIVVRTRGKWQPDSLSIGYVAPSGAGLPEIVFRNQRKPFEPVAMQPAARVRLTAIWQILERARRFRQPVFLTSRMAGGAFVSTRYDGLDPQGIISILETQCGFQSTTLTARGPADHAALENRLRLNRDQIRHIRWILASRFGGRWVGEPRGARITARERVWIERYTRLKNGRPSRYLTRESANMLLRENFVARRKNFERSRNFRRHGDWYSFMNASGTACEIRTDALHWAGDQFFYAPQMRFVARRSATGSRLGLYIVTPNPFIGFRPVIASVDGRRYRLQVDRGVVKPRRIRSGVVSSDVIRAIFRGRDIVVEGTGRRSRRPVRVVFSASGFTSAFNSMIRDCNRYGLRAWR